MNISIERFLEVTPCVWKKHSSFYNQKEHNKDIDIDFVIDFGASI